jgi:hypothetical protein
MKPDILSFIKKKVKRELPSLSDGADVNQTNIGS